MSSLPTAPPAPPSRAADQRGAARAVRDAMPNVLDDSGVGQAVSDAAGDARPWVERLARAGLATKGLVYLLIGVLAAQAALGVGGGTTDTRGALQQVVEAPFGMALLGLLAVGLAGYTLWRLAEALLDTERKGTDLSGLLARGGYLASAAVYAGLGLFAVRLLLGAESAVDGETSMRDWTAWLMEQPLGRWLVAAVGAGVLGSALVQLWRAWSTDFCEYLALDRVSPAAEVWIIRAGRLGFAARGVALAIVGGFLLLAALHARPEEAHGLGGALATLAAQPFGPWLLGVVAAGLIAYGLYMLAEARLRRLRLA